jgi:hypothetical protein
MNKTNGICSTKDFTVKVRIPGWAQRTENPYGLYTSEVKSKPGLKVNGKKNSS